MALLEDHNHKDYEKIMIKALIFSIDQSIEPNQEELARLTDYLFTVEQWGYYEIILL